MTIAKNKGLLGSSSADSVYVSKCPTIYKKTVIPSTFPFPVSDEKEQKKFTQQ
jgi:hypothetical protein